jgi:GT2 family glycosyltransferase
MTRSASVVENLNLAIRSLNNNSEWVWIMGDDHAFGRDTLMKLLKVLYENDYSIVVPLCCRRGPPFGLVVFDEERDEDYLGRGQFHTMQFPDLPKSGQFECIAAGSAGMLINRGVFDEMGEPWFENSDNITTNEDVVFCKKARALGHKVMVDVDTRIGHIGVVGVWPDYRDGQWGITLDFQGVGQNHIFLAGGIREGNNGAPEPRTGTLDWE